MPCAISYATGSVGQGVLPPEGNGPAARKVEKSTGAPSVDKSNAATITLQSVTRAAKLRPA